ncbi:MULTISPECIES: DUF2254 family protein [unclassified Streptomyces]|uniref:DUF2254 family protein n=1 Tax=unclassified Streptomyces TaxID=2593676 RepID=UPI0006AE3C35|nr:MULTISPECIES: DUF2254 family protein [unclassified Streptomyces]
MPDHADGPVRPGARERRRRATSFRRPGRTVRRDLSQLLCALAGLGLGLPAPLVTGGPQVDAGRVVSVLFTLGFGVISLVSVIYSVLFLVVQFSASTFTPRLGLFRHEPIVWRTFAFTIGLFVFCITSGLAIGSREGVSVFVPCTAVLLTLVALALMRTLQMRAFDSIQLGQSLTAIAARAHRLYDALYVDPYAPAAAQPLPATDTDTGTGTEVRWTRPPAVLQSIDVPALLALAREHDFSVAFRVAPGTTLTEGTVIARVAGDDARAAVLLTTLSTGVERTFDQDPELPFRLLADIALRALSPAVNDPATAVEVLDRLEALLIRLAGRDLAVGRFHDSAGRPRVSVPVPGWDHYVRTAVDDVLFAATGSPMALRRTRDLLRTLVERVPEDRRAVVLDRLRWAERTGAEAYPLVWEDDAGEGREGPFGGHTRGTPG